MKKYLKIVLLVIVAIILVGTFVFLYQKSRPKVVVYETLKPEVTDLQKTTVATGKVEPRDEILIKPQISGIIDEVYKEAGQAVRKGEVIAKVKVIPELGQLNSAESRVRLAEINATQAETDFSRVKKLYEDQLISREEYEKSEVAVKQAREEKQTAKDNLEIVKEGITKNSASFSSTMIRSTIDGLILDVPVKAGNSVIMSNTFNDGTTIATVANMNDLIFRGQDNASLVQAVGADRCQGDQFRLGLHQRPARRQIISRGSCRCSHDHSICLVMIQKLSVDIDVEFYDLQGSASGNDDVIQSPAFRHGSIHTADFTV